MLVQWIERGIMGLYNRQRHRRERRAAAAARLAARDAGGPVEPDHVLLGHTLPWSPSSLPAGPGRAGGASSAFALPAAVRARGAGADGAAVSLPLSVRRRHLYAIGATGCGKTNFLLRLIEHDLARNQSLCVIDLRGDLVDRVLLRVAAAEAASASAGSREGTDGDKPQQAPGTARVDRQRRQRVLILDLRQSAWTVGFNPLQGPGDPYARAYHVLSVLKTNAESWGVQLEETLRNALLALAEGGYSLLELEPLLSDADFRESVLARVSDPYVRSFFARYGELTPDKQTQWRLPVLNKVSPFLAIPQVRRMLGERNPKFTLSDLLDREPGAVILVSLGVDRLHGAAHLVGGLVISSLQNAIMARVDQKESERVPVHLYVDEFENLVSEGFEAFLAEGRRFGLGLTLSHQNLSQMPAGLGQMILNNAHTQMYFQTGAVDASELAREVVPHPGETREQIRMALTTQKVGEAYLLRRGETEPTHRVKILPCPDPKVSEAQVAALREAALSAFGRRSQDVDGEIAAGRAVGSGPAAAAEAQPAGERAADSERQAQAAVAAQGLVLEVRHGKRPGRYAAPATPLAEPAPPAPAAGLTTDASPVGPQPKKQQQEEAGSRDG